MKTHPNVRPRQGAPRWIMAAAVGIVAGSVSVAASPARAAQIAIGSASGEHGWLVTVPVTLDPGAAPISGTQNDITFDSVNTRIAEKPDGMPDCTVNPGLDQEASFAFLPPGCIGTECTTVRAAVYTVEASPPAIPNGNLYSCKVKISTSAPIDTYALLNSEARSSRSNGNEVGTTAANGQVEVTSGHCCCSIDPAPRTSSFGVTVLLMLVLAMGLQRWRRRPALPFANRVTTTALGALLAILLGQPAAAQPTAAPVKAQGGWASADGTRAGTWAAELGLAADGGFSGHLTLTDLAAFERANVKGFVADGHVLFLLYGVDSGTKLGELTASLSGDALSGTLSTVDGSVATVAGQWLPQSLRPPVPQAILDGLAAGQPQDVVVKFDDRAITAEATAMRARRGVAVDDAATREFKAARFATLKSGVLGRVRRDNVAVLRDYSHLPTMFVRVQNEEALAELLAQPGVARVHQDVVFHTHLTESLPVIGQPGALAAGFNGGGTTVAVLDTGADPTAGGLPVFGNCGVTGELIGSPGCGIVFAADFTTDDESGEVEDDGALDNNGHGTHVAGTALAVAPGSRIAALDVCNAAGSCKLVDLADAINWAIANRDSYNIVAMNMSIGGGVAPTVCSDSELIEEVALARAAGIVSVISSGNNSLPYLISYPACTPGAVRVGASWDADLGQQNFDGLCIDYITGIDRVACFSNSASVVTTLAPGCSITVAGDTKCGTSMAAPHVSGAMALLGTSVFANDSVDCRVARVVRGGVDLLDHRNGIVFPRLDVAAAVATRPSSVGDCNGDNHVRIGEVMRAVAILHGTRPLSSCPAIDADENGAAAVEECLTAVKIMMTGCGAGESGNP